MWHKHSVRGCENIRSNQEKLPDPDPELDKARAAEEAKLGRSLTSEEVRKFFERMMEED